jgi:hypothetical protein
MQWIYKNNIITELPENCVGFVYLITNTVNGRKYIGKKLARFKRSRPPLKGRKNKRRYKVMISLLMSIDLVKTSSQGRYFSTVNPKRNCPTWRHVSSLHVRFWSPMITTTATSV